MSSNRIWAALGVGLVAIFGAQALKAKQKVDDKRTGGSPEARAFAAQLNRQLAYTRSVRIPGALTREEMDPESEPLPGWNKSLETMPVLKDTPLEPVLAMCLENENYFKRFPNSIFCGWEVHEVATAHESDRFWRLRQTVFFKLPVPVQG